MKEEQKTSVPKAPEIAFLRTELLTGLTLSRIALSTNHTETRFLPGTNLAPDQEVEIRSMLEKWELRLLGRSHLGIARTPAGNIRILCQL
jgi:hypothetical protein